MKPNTHLKKLLKIDISPDSSYSDIEVGLSNLKRIIKSTSQKEVIRGGIRKMGQLFHAKNRIAKSLALKYLEKVSKHVEEVDTNILHMFYSTDPRISDLAVRYVCVFSRFFKNNDIVFYYVYRTKSKYRRDALQALILQSPRYRAYEKDFGVGDLDLFENVRRNAPEEYFGRLALPKLVELSSMYPCLVRYFKFTRKFLGEELEKRDRYSQGVLHRLGKILGVEERRETMWDEFLVCLAWMKHGRFDKSIRVLERLCSLEISKEYKIIFEVFIRKMSRRLDSRDGTARKRAQITISSSFEIELCGLSQNSVYKMLFRLFKDGVKYVDSKSRKAKNV